MISRFASGKLPLRGRARANDVLTRQQKGSGVKIWHLPYLTCHESSTFGGRTRIGGLQGTLRSDRRRHRHMNLCARPNVAPKFQLSPRQLCSLLDSRQAPMSRRHAFVEDLWVNSDSVIAEPDVEFLRVVLNLNFNPGCARVVESVS